MNSRRPVQKALHRVAALICIAAYLCGAAQVVPDLLALGARLEGSHIVQILSDQNCVTVVLAHFQTQPIRQRSTLENQREKIIHSHGAAAWALCVLSSGGSADHVASFSGTSHLGQIREATSAQLSKLISDYTSAKPPRQPGETISHLISLTPVHCMTSCGNQLVLRSTVLLV